MANNSFGNIIQLSTFGESHGRAMGGILDGIPAGLELDLESIQRDLNRRKPGQSEITTARNESDQIEILSGVYENKTTGSPIGFIVRNKDQESGDYNHLKDVFRHGHADGNYQSKYGHRDHRGGGRSSARETLNWVAGGAIAKQLLAHYGIEVAAFVSRVKDIKLTKSYKDLDLDNRYKNDVRCPDTDVAEQMREYILQIKEQGNTVGGIISAVIQGVPAGLGEPVFNKLHAALGKSMLGINAAKFFEIGDGYAAISRLGNEYNNDFDAQGGISGGISSGDDITFKVGFKAVATLMKGQKAKNTEGQEVELEGKGRHDPCVLPRAVPIVEALSALVIADFFLLNRISQI